MNMLHGITYGDAVDLFAVEFTSRECVLGGRSYPLGFFVAEALDKIPNIVGIPVFCCTYEGRTTGYF